MILVGKKSISKIRAAEFKDKKRTLKLLRDRTSCVRVYACICAVAANRTEQNRTERNRRRNGTQRRTSAKRELTAAGAQHVYWRISQS